MTSPDDLRIGDAEREAAMAALREHYAQGRLTHEELEERIELALSARTGRELALAHADLPDLYGSRSGGRDGSAEGRERGHRGPGWAVPTGVEPWHGGNGWAGPGGVGPWHGRRGHASRRAGHRHPAWEHRAGRRGRPPVAPFLFLMLVIGVASAGFWTLKFFFVAWLAMGVLGMLHRRRWHPRAGGALRR
ncbi:DUF1707 SHOCT-like domain-containing protein [Streptosporangium sp. CA-135522]|uniref:DUF1707 SHOCT-like domain-containing protein n=1 Tax=Streptosporangium sp. CA-135522 TaxID=3240072 RepID=UPI003D917755